ncbi:MAG: hypothetical protein Q8O40_17295 [Chloroflexota bacterium]|nr:hypothetical protein [Chloroflexota bacterium]
MWKLAVVAVVVLAIVGVSKASQATIGTALVGAAATLGVLARIWQAEEHHGEMKDALNTLADATKPAPEAPSSGEDLRSEVARRAMGKKP